MKEATCLETGLTEGSYCSVCNSVITAQNEIPKTACNYGVNYCCNLCGSIEFDECQSLNDYKNLCSVSDKTLEYNNSKPIIIYLNYLNANGYNFIFSGESTKVILKGDTSFYNITINIKNISTNAFDLILDDVKISSSGTAITSNAETLNIYFNGTSNVIQTAKGANGNDGVSGESIMSNNVHGKNGSDASIAINASGNVNISYYKTAKPSITIKGGDGENGGNGGVPFLISGGYCGNG